MTHQINRILSDEYTTKILKFIFKNRAVKILRTIARTGRHNTSVPWVYYKNEITQNKFSTFISLKDLLQNFWVWLETVNLFAIAFFKRLAISEIIYRYFVNEGDHVFCQRLGWGRIIEKNITEKLKHPQLWIELESNFQIEIVEPCFVEIF